MNKLLHVYYQVKLLRRMQDLRKEDMTVKAYIEEFYKLDIGSSGHVDDDIDKVSRYLNGSRISIQDEINYVKIDSVEEPYDYDLKAEDVLTKRHEKIQRGRGGVFQRGRATSCEENKRSNSAVQDKDKGEHKGEDRGKIEWKGGSSHQGRGSSYQGGYNREGFHVTFLKFEEEYHRAFECTHSEMKIGNTRENALAQEESLSPPSEPEKWNKV